MSDRKLDWCSMWRARARGEGSLDGFWLLLFPPRLELGCDASFRLRGVPRDESLLLLPRLRSLVLLSSGAKLFPLFAVIPASFKLNATTESKTRWSSSSPGALRKRNLGRTVSPGLNLALCSCMSSSVLCFAGFACRNMSSSVVTVAFGLVPRTESRHDGHVYGCSDLAVEA